MKNYKVSEKAKELAKQVIEWLESLQDKDGLNDYLWNLRAAAASGIVTARTKGILASAIPAFRRVQEQKAAAQVYAASQFQGTVGKREVFHGLKLVNITSFNTDFGASHLHKFVDAAGNVYVWFSSSGTWKQGSTYTLKATVKKHENYTNRNTGAEIKQTVLSRCTEVSREDATLTEVETTRG